MWEEHDFYEVTWFSRTNVTNEVSWFFWIISFHKAIILLGIYILHVVLLLVQLVALSSFRNLFILRMSIREPIVNIINYSPLIFLLLPAKTERQYLEAITLPWITLNEHNFFHGPTLPPPPFTFHSLPPTLTHTHIQTDRHLGFGWERPVTKIHRN